jgi:tetrahydromethanopterin S-methyltransferase subunit F
MIQHMTTFEKLTIISQGFAKIAAGFWVAIVLILIAFAVLAIQENAE